MLQRVLRSITYSFPKTNSQTNRHINCGSAFIFRLEYGAWQQEAQLLPGTISRGSHFGQAVQVKLRQEEEGFWPTKIFVSLCAQSCTGLMCTAVGRPEHGLFT